MIRFCVGEMPKRPKKQRRTYTWAVYREGQVLIFVGFIDDAPDEKTATALAAEEYNFPPDELDRLVVRQLGEQCSAVRHLERRLAAETEPVKRERIIMRIVQEETKMRALA
jgi:hypothetical protein